MKLYLIQVGYKGTNGKLQIAEQEFEGEAPDQALGMAKAYYSDQIRYRKIEEMIFSTPVEAVASSTNGSVSIRGSANGSVISTGNNRVVIQQGNSNINLGVASNVSIGDNYH